MVPHAVMLGVLESWDEGNEVGTPLAAYCEMVLGSEQFSLGKF